MKSSLAAVYCCLSDPKLSMGKGASNEIPDLILQRWHWNSHGNVAPCHLMFWRGFQSHFTNQHFSMGLNLTAAASEPQVKTRPTVWTKLLCSVLWVDQDPIYFWDWLLHRAQQHSSLQCLQGSTKTPLCWHLLWHQLNKTRSIASVRGHEKVFKGKLQLSLTYAIVVNQIFYTNFNYIQSKLIRAVSQLLLYFHIMSI